MNKLCYEDPISVSLRFVIMAWINEWRSLWVSSTSVTRSQVFFFIPTREKHVFLQRLQQTIWQLAKTNLAELPLMHFFFAVYIGQGCCLIDPVLPSLLDACFCFPLTVVKSMSREYPFQWVFVSSMGSYFTVVHKLVLHIEGFIR